MSVRAISMVWERSAQAGSRLLLMLAIADYAKDNGGGAYPSIGTLARKARMSERNCQRMIGHLLDAGELTIAYKAGPHGANIYAIQLPDPGASETLFAGNSDADPRDISVTGDAGATRHGRHPGTGVTPAPASGGGDAGVVGGVTPASPNTSRTVKEPSASLDGKTIDAVFERWWPNVLRKTHKKEARANFAVALAETDYETLEEAIKDFAREHAEDDPKGLKEPATLLWERFWLGKGGAGHLGDPQPAARTVEKVTVLQVTAGPAEQARFAHVMQMLLQEFGFALWETWFSDLALIEGDADAWTIAAPSRFKREWIAPRYGDRIRAHGKRRIEIVVGVPGVGDQASEVSQEGAGDFA